MEISRYPLACRVVDQAELDADDVGVRRDDILTYFHAVNDHSILEVIDEEIVVAEAGARAERVSICIIRLEASFHET